MIDKIANRYFMKYMPEVLNATSEDEKLKIIKSYVETEKPEYGFYHDNAKKFFLENDYEEEFSQGVNCYLFGKGPHQFYHNEHNLKSVGMIDFETVYDIQERITKINVDLMNGTDGFNETVEERIKSGNLWLAYRNPIPTALIMTSFDLELFWQLEDVFDDHCNTLYESPFQLEMVSENKDSIEVSLVETNNKTRHINRYMRKKKGEYLYSLLEEIISDYTNDNMLIYKKDDGNDSYTCVDLEQLKRLRIDSFEDDLATFDIVEHDKFFERVKQDFTTRINYKVEEFYQEAVKLYSNVISFPKKPKTINVKKR